MKIVNEKISADENAAVEANFNKKSQTTNDIEFLGR
jgi:hypothetical protein